MKKLFYLLFVIQLLFNFQSSNLYAQGEPPQGIIYQAEARDGNGNLIKNKALTVRISILEGSLTSNIKWQGDYNITTDNNGLFTLIIGQGTTYSGSFSSITWGLSDHYLNVKINDKKGWVDMGTTQLLSVPYAFYAQTAANGITSDQIAAIASNSLKISYPTNDQTKLASIQAYAEKNVNADWTATSGEAQILNKPTGNKPGDMQYWNGEAWVLVLAGQPGQFLQFTASNKPEWTTVSQNNDGGNPLTINTNSATNVTSNSATSGGSIMNNSGMQITSCGVCCSPNHNPTISDYITNDNLENGTFTSNLNGLSPGTYYVRAYATYNGGPIYGNEVSFTISMNTGQNYQLEYISGGNQTYPGGGMPQPMIFKVKNLTNNAYVTNLATENLSITATGPGSLDVSFNNQNNYCGNGDNTCFGGFFTVPATCVSPYKLNISVSLMKNNQNIYTVSITENISINNNGGAPFTVSTVGTSAISYNSAVFISSITGDRSTITDHGVCWNTTGMPTINDSKTSQDPGSDFFTSNLLGLSPNTMYYVRAYATNSGGTVYYGNQIMFTTTTSVTAATTPLNVTATTATFNATILYDGGHALTACGMCWNTSGNPTLPTDFRTSSGVLTGSYLSILTGLVANTTYFIRAYAINSDGTVYSNEVRFTMPATGQSTVSDIDGNVYQTVTIGSQVWMAENLKTTKYRNGNLIPNVTNASAWFDPANTIGSYCNFNNDINNATTYGRLYNWYAVKDSRNIAPEGWHVPSKDEWAALIASLGGDAVAGGKLKETGTSHWIATNYGATNESQFTALPGGYISDFNFTFTGMGIMGYWWSSTENSATNIPQAVAQYLINTNSNISWYYCSENNGYSIRCVKD
jgi:uncharacterized protein (TIGR02145 family)